MRPVARAPSAAPSASASTHAVPVAAYKKMLAAVPSRPLSSAHSRDAFWYVHDRSSTALPAVGTPPNASCGDVVAVAGAMLDPSDSSPFHVPSNDDTATPPAAVACTPPTANVNGEAGAYTVCGLTLLTAKVP